jgi:hypothetical protein
MADEEGHRPLVDAVLAHCVGSKSVRYFVVLDRVSNGRTRANTRYTRLFICHRAHYSEAYLRTRIGHHHPLLKKERDSRFTLRAPPARELYFKRWKKNGEDARLIIT